MWPDFFNFDPTFYLCLKNPFLLTFPTWPVFFCRVTRLLKFVQGFFFKLSVKFGHKKSEIYFKESYVTNKKVVKKTSHKKNQFTIKKVIYEVNILLDQFYALHRYAHPYVHVYESDILIHRYISVRKSIMPIFIN